MYFYVSKYSLAFVYIIFALVFTITNTVRSIDDDDYDDVCEAVPTPEAQSEDAIFNEIEYLQYKSGKPFGRMLDSGTGENSIVFVSSLVTDKHDLGVTEWTAITADDEMRKSVKQKMRNLGLPLPENEHVDGRGCSGLVVGNWMDIENELCAGELFDTILVDYLIGAMDSFAPFYQYDIFVKLRERLSPGGKMYIIGLQPIPEINSDEAEILSRMKRIRDACIMLAGKRPYREYPLSWVVKSLETSGFNILNMLKFDIKYAEEDVHAQLEVARGKLKYFPSEPLAQEMSKLITELGKEVSTVFSHSPGQQLESGFDYLVVAELPSL